jgi:hypothetical protein
MLEYFMRIWRLGRDLHRGFAPTSVLSRITSRPNSTSQSPLCACCFTTRRGAAVRGAARRSRPYGLCNVTLLATDAVVGLMAQHRSSRWLDAPVIPDALVCNIGDCLMRLVDVSTPHKVVSPPGHDHYSVAFFLDPI